MRERDVEAALVREATKKGALTYKFASPARRGVPDRIVVLPGGRVVFVELKRPGGKLSALQIYEMQRLAAAGAECYVLDSIASVGEFIRGVVDADL